MAARTRPLHKTAATCHWVTVKPYHMVDLQVSRDQQGLRCSPELDMASAGPPISTIVFCFCLRSFNNKVEANRSAKRALFAEISCRALYRSSEHHTPMSELSDVKGEPMKKGVDHASKTHKSGRNDEDPLGCATTGQLISTVENFNSYLENRAEDTMRFPCSSVVEEVDLRTATQDSATDMDKRCGYHLLPHQQRVADEHGLLHDAGKSKSALRAARILAKAGVVLVSLASTHVMRNYALSQAASSPANAKRWWRWIGDSDKVDASTRLASGECSLTEFSTHSKNPTGLQSPIHYCY
jgi:hypothetical protein